jgi:hypothetical protein
MVKLKKQIALILIFSFFLSLIPNFLYTESRVLAGCPTDCTEEERDGEIYCINCPISCSWETETFINKSCLPSEETGEWTCGIEIPIGEVMDRTTYLASRMLAEFGGIVKGGEEMVIWSDRLLTDYKEWDCSGYTNWGGKETKCETECDKRYRITAGILQPAQSDLECESETSLGKGIYPKDCNEDHNQCIPCAEYCAREEHKEECCWIDSSQPNPNYDPEHPEREKEYLSCKYCKKEDEDGTKYCYEYCFVWTCRGCCYQYFNPIINGYTGMEELQKALKNDIEEKTPAGEDLPDNFKLKRSYILKQLDFARCELARCWISAEDYYDVLSGEKVGKHLLTCEQVAEMGLFDDDQFFCFVAQMEDEWNTIVEVWTEPKEHWWQWPIVFFKTIFYVQLLSWKMIWHMIKEWTDFGQEEGCYQTNYYCCQM